MSTRAGRAGRRHAKARAARASAARATVARPPALKNQALREVALLVACAELAIFILAFDTSILNVFDLTKATYTHALAWALLGVLVVVALTDGLRVPRSPLFVAFYAVLATEVLATITATDRYVATYGEVGRYLGLTTHAVLALIAVAIAVTLDYPRRVSWLGWTVGAAAALASVYALIQRAGLDPVSWVDLDAQARPFASFGNPDFYGQFLAVVAMGSAALVTFSMRRTWHVWLGGALGLVSLGLLFVVATRGAIIGLAVAGVMLVVLWLRRTGLTRSALRRLSLGFGGLVVATAIVVVATPIGARVVDTIEGVGVRDRVILYTAAAQMFIDHPIFGVGFENFAVVYPRYQVGEAFVINGRNSTQTSSHTWILHVATTTGIVGLVALLGLLAACALHAWRRARDPDATGVLVATVAAAAFYGSGLVLPGAQSIQWIPWACIGVVLASDVRAAPVVSLLPPLRLPSLLRGAIAVGLAGVAILQLGAIDANRAAKIAEAALSPATAQQSVQAARTATRSDPGRAVYWNDLGRALELVSDQSGARVAYLEATKRSPYTPAFWWNLARMQLVFAQRGDSAARDAAYSAMRSAIEASPQNPETFDRFARIQYAFGDYAGAIESEKQAIRSYPIDPLYYSFGSDAARQLRDTAVSLDFLRHGIAGTDSNELRVTLGRRLMEVGQTDEARQVLREAVTKDPSNAEAVALLRQAEGQ